MGHIAGSEVIRASLWLRPTGPARERVLNAARFVRQRCGGLEIRPHVSLLAGIECTRADADRRLRRFAARVRPFTVELGEVGWSDDYLRCLYIGVVMSRELEDAHRLAHEIFEMNPPDLFEPHVTLHYGELDLETKRLLAAGLGTLDASFTAASVHLVSAAKGIPVAEWRTLFERTFTPQPRDRQAPPGPRPRP